ncbi:MAG: hypothetical protein LBR23_05370 [Spirochaetaceae bacterium]|jgi:hypothetical protein|nr:hypothetical protein [Spirochaetaceae bacterium]
MNESEVETLNKIHVALERIAVAIEKQKQGRFEQILTILAAIATTLGLFTTLDIFFKWFGG